MNSLARPFALLARFFILLAVCASARAATVALPTALDTTGLTWTTSGADEGVTPAPVWTGQTLIGHDGVDAARSPSLVSQGAESWLETTVTGPGVLSWQWRFDMGEDFASMLEIQIGDSGFPTQSLYQPTPWTAATETLLENGPVKIRWRFVRSGFSETADATDVAFVDAVSFTRFGPPVLQPATAVVARGFTVNWTALPAATEYVVEFAPSADFTFSFFSPPLAPPATSHVLTGLDPLATYHYRLVARGPDGLEAVSASASVTLPAIQRPTNDNFANARALSGLSGSVAATNLDATLQTDEPPTHQGSVWFTWTAPSAGRWSFAATPASEELLPPALFLYTGSGLANLVDIATDPGTGVLEFDTLAGVAYRLAADNFAGGQGAFTLAWQRLAAHTPPANDAFANSVVLSGASGSVTGTNAYASTEAGEPASTGAGRSVWWRWTATATGQATFNASASAITPTLAAYTGASVSALTLVAEGVSTLSFPVVSGTTYRIAIDGLGGAQGDLTLAWSVAAATVPQVITFGALADVGRLAEPFLVSATSDSGLPVTIRVVSGPATLVDGVLTLAGATGTVRLRAEQAGDATYLPASLETTFLVQPVPTNDALANAIALTGTSVTGTNLHASAQDLDPQPASHSVWWRYTANAPGVLRLNTAGSAIPTTLAVVTGSTLDDIVVVAADARPGQRGLVEFPVTVGTTYRIAVDALDGQQGAITLDWSLKAPSLSQTITFESLPDVGVNAPSFDLIATATSGLPVSFSLAPTPAATLADGFLTLTGQPGTVQLTATQAGDAYYAAATAVTVTFAVRPPPANDAFANALALTGASVNGSTIDASAEPSEPYPANRSVWWRYTANAPGVLRLDTAASAIPVTVSVLTGSAVDTLQTVIADTRPGQRGLVEFPVTVGTTYHIAVDTLDGQQGAIHLAWSLVEPSLPQTITFETLPDVGVNAPSFALNASASSGLPISFSLARTPAATLTNGFLTLTGQPGSVQLTATQPGDAYYAAATSVTVTFAVRPPPANDAFASAIELTGASVTGSNLDASAQPGEPFPANHSVWWRYTATAPGVLRIDTAASAIPVTLTVVTGSAVGSGEVVIADTRPDQRGRVEFPVTVGATYRIAVDNIDGLQGAIHLAWTFIKPSLSQTITFESLPTSLVAGDPAFPVSATASSGLPVTITLLKGPATLVDGVITLTNAAGTVQLVASQPGNAYYTAAPPVTRTFTVVKAPDIRITLDNLRQPYDGTRRPVSATTDLQPRFANLVVTYSGPGHPLSEDEPVNAGTYTVVATADGSSLTSRLIIYKAPLTVTANDARKLAGQDNPPFTLSYSGFKGDDDATDFTRPPVIKTTATKKSPGKVGGYPITLSGGLATNYAFTFVPGTLFVDTFSGRYEALLTDADSELPVAKIEITIATTGASFTGKLTLPTETAAVAIKGALDLDAVSDTATALIPVVTKTNRYTLQLDLLLNGDFSATLSLQETLLGSTSQGRMVFVPAKGEKLTWAGAHTALLRDPTSLEPDSETAPSAPGDLPAGSGHALATIDAKGNLKLSGRLADGAPLTATLAPDVLGAYRLFALPYAKRLHSYVAGTLPLAEHPDLAPRRYLPAAAGQSVYWTKAALPSPTKTPDKSYRAGFGPLGLTVTIDPWLPPATKATATLPVGTLAQRLDLPTDSAGAAVFLPAFGPAALDLGQSDERLPTLLSLNAKNAVTVTAPVTVPANASKFSLKITPSTGAFSGSFTLSDIIPAPTTKNPDATKTIARKIAFTGVLRQAPEADESASFGSGYFLVPALPGASDTAQPSGEIELRFP